MVYAINGGVPFFLSNPEAQVSQDILRLARSVTGHDEVTLAEDKSQRQAQQRKSLFARR